MAQNTEDMPKLPLEKGRGILSDIRFFFLKNPKISTLIRFESETERENYNQRIRQRLGITVMKYSILNIHRIGINAPVKYVFEELLKWDGDSTCWPNYIARVDRINGNLENIRIFLLGRRKYPLGFKKSFLGLKYIPMFNINAIKIRDLPDLSDFDNARYLLYRCSGGYPIGIFSIYVRSPITSLGEIDQTQLFFVVGFNFYGKEAMSMPSFLKWIWEKIHNRVTSNILNRFKTLCEWRFQIIKEDLKNSRYF